MERHWEIKQESMEAIDFALKRMAKKEKKKAMLTKQQQVNQTKKPSKRA